MRFVFLLACLAACTDSKPPSPPARASAVVSLLPAFTEQVVALGAADRLVGCTEYCRPPHDVARVAWRDAAAAEAILRLKPDLVLRQAPRRAEDALRDVLEANGVPVLSLPTETIADVERSITAIGKALGERERAAKQLEDFQRRLVHARARARGRTPRAVLFVINRDAGRAANVMAAGPGTFLDELIRFAGGRNVLAAFKAPYPTLRLETLVRLKPQVVIDNLPGEVDHAAAWEHLRKLGVPAVVDGRVFAVRDNTLLIPGPRIPEAIEQLVEMIHGDA